jgi:hypothetical protein
MARREDCDDDDDDRPAKGGSTGLLIAGIAAGVLLLLLCCGGAGIGALFLFPGGAGGLGAPSDIVGRWEIDDISKLILEFRPDGTGTIEIPEARTRIQITYKLQGGDLTIAPAQGLAFGEGDVVARLERTRVSRIGNQLRMEALAGPAQGQAMLLKKIN